MTLTYETDNAKTDLQLPDTVADLTPEQFREAVRHLTRPAGAPAADSLLTVVAGLPQEVVDSLTPFQRYRIEEELAFVTNPDGYDFRDWKVPSVTIGGVVYYGPVSGFGNATWGEFVYADQCAIQGLHRALICALFRPKRKDYDGETDIRVPFTTYGTKHRFDLFDGIDPLDEAAILLNYRATRRAALERAYPEIFPYAGEKADKEKGDDDSDSEAEDEKRPSSFSWVLIHRNLLGDRIQDEEKFLQLGVHTVLHRLNEVIKENRHRKK